MIEFENKSPYGVDDYIDFENCLNDDKYYPIDRDGQLSYQKVVAFFLKAGYLYNPIDKNWYLLNNCNGVYTPIDEDGVFLDVVRFVSAQAPDKNIQSSAIKSIRDRLKGLSKPYMDRLRDEFLTYHNEYCLSWDSPDFIPVRNGLIHPETMELMPHCAYFVYPNVLNFDYKKLSYEEIIDSPIYDYYLDILPDKPTLEFYLWWVGSVLFCDDMLRMCVFLYGAGGTGKSTLSLGLASILGHGHRGYLEISYQSLKNNNRFFTSSLEGKRLAILDEMSTSGGAIDDGLIKQLTGGNEYMTVEIKNGPFKTVPITSKYLMIGNSYPVIKQDEALRERMFIIGCHKKQDSSIRKVIKSEEALNWLFNAAQYFYWKRPISTINNLAELKTPSMIEEEDRFRELDPLTYWLRDYVGTDNPTPELVQLRLDGERTRATYMDYQRSMEENGNKAMKIQLFTQRMCLDYGLISRSTTAQGEKIRIFERKGTA